MADEHVHAAVGAYADQDVPPGVFAGIRLRRVQRVVELSAGRVGVARGLRAADHDAVGSGAGVAPSRRAASGTADARPARVGEVAELVEADTGERSGQALVTERAAGLAGRALAPVGVHDVERDAVTGPGAVAVGVFRPAPHVHVELDGQTAACRNRSREQERSALLPGAVGEPEGALPRGVVRALGACRERAGRRRRGGGGEARRVAASLAARLPETGRGRRAVEPLRVKLRVKLRRGGGRDRGHEGDAREGRREGRHDEREADAPCPLGPSVRTQTSTSHNCSSPDFAIFSPLLFLKRRRASPSGEMPAEYALVRGSPRPFRCAGRAAATTVGSLKKAEANWSESKGASSSGYVIKRWPLG